ncbi:MAG: hypothetical protein OXC28_18230 [Defluviicoccus sp.]|nr:hypothetical protein [Defluviicoccus sp.]
MMLHQDGSRHAWLAGRAPLDLIVTLDDATSEIYSAFLVEEEGTASTFRALKQVFAAKGLPGVLYTDRGSHYFHTPEAGGKVDKGRRTQVGRALHQLGIEHIAAYSPEATPLRQGHGPGARVSRRHARRLPRTQMPGPVPGRRFEAVGASSRFAASSLSSDNSAGAASLSHTAFRRAIRCRPGVLFGAQS